MQDKLKNCAGFGIESHGTLMVSQIWEKPVLQDYGSVGCITKGIDGTTERAEGGPLISYTTP